MRFVREIGEKGQVVIPKDIRDMLNLKRCSKISFEVERTGDNLGEVKIMPEKESQDDNLKEFFMIARTKGKDLTLKDLKKIEEESYDLP